MCTGDMQIPGYTGTLAPADRKQHPRATVLTDNLVRSHSTSQLLVYARPGCAGLSLPSYKDLIPFHRKFWI